MLVLGHDGMDLDEMGTGCEVLTVLSGVVHRLEVLLVRSIPPKADIAVSEVKSGLRRPGNG